MEAKGIAVRDFTSASHTRGRGRVAESEAKRWLERRGYRILETNFATRPGEIDVIARDGDTVCFIEIKARSGETFGPATGAVDARKQRRLARVAALYLAQAGWDGPCRFDVLGLDRRDGEWQYTLVQDAFSV